MNELFPIYIKLDQIQTLVVGAGPVGLEKLEALISNSPKANIHVVAEEVIPEFKKFVSDKANIRLSQRSFDRQDIEGIDLIILATNNPDFNNEVRKLASENHILLNVADKPSLCDFYLGSVVQKGNLKIGISTNGKSPTIAKRLKEFLNDLLPEEIDQTLDLMQTMRNSLKGDFQEKIKVLNAHTKDLLTNTSNDSAN
ncbi:precorrin-2 dehydrogenase/sirohydrochlorin ferrochelatase family protein [Sphingobacterium pedocola]|uniref:precorrin-2 dehydrogenase n=1 Tax=Sphingobacterium pedocola TaxID=2082722 RepID=A0ABR9T5F1_9SPHI|nr:bifunctional precorrin-2 dehydrogenase/sirohydrochlorin ferrochelatase [Sphingobacterium pedocola]MBE8720560.1 siroheme synthase [Sphingobacterium pedocola]